MKKHFFSISSLIFLLVFSSFSLTAQTEKKPAKADPTVQEVEMLRQTPKHGIMSFTFSNMVPQDVFQTNLGKAGQGFSVFGAYAFDPIPVAVGANIDFFFLGSDTKYYNYSYVTPIGVKVYYTDTVKLSNTMVPFNFFIRIQPNLFDWVFPYIEGIGGLSYMTSKLEYKADTRLVNVTQKKDDDNFAWNYGAGVGVAVKFAEVFNLPSQHLQFLADVRMRYLMGSETEYTNYKYNETTKQIEENKFKSATDFVQFSLGLTIRF